MCLIEYGLTHNDSRIYNGSGRRMPYVQYVGWCSCSIALETRCSKFRGELTSFQAVCSLGVEPSPTCGAFPFIVQGGATCLHISNVVSWSHSGVLHLRQSSGPSRSVGSGEACVRLIFLGDGLSSCCPVPGRSGWHGHSVGRSEVISHPVRPYMLLRL